MSFLSLKPAPVGITGLVRTISAVENATKSHSGFWYSFFISISPCKILFLRKVFPFLSLFRHAKPKNGWSFCRFFTHFSYFWYIIHHFVLYVNQFYIILWYIFYKGKNMKTAKRIGENLKAWRKKRSARFCTWHSNSIAVLKTVFSSWISTKYYFYAKCTRSRQTNCSAWNDNNRICKAPRFSWVRIRDF